MQKRWFKFLLNLNSPAKCDLGSKTLLIFFFYILIRGSKIDYKNGNVSRVKWIMKPGQELRIKKWGMAYDWQTWDPKKLCSLTETPTYGMLQLNKNQNTVPNTKYNHLLHYYVLLYTHTQWLSNL